MNLAREFIRSKGEAVQIAGLTVVQMDRIDLKEASIKVRFLGETPSGMGVALKAPTGFIKLSDGSSATLVHVWDDPGLPREAVHQVSAQGDLRVWNIYRVSHPGGVVTVDAWTGNAGMVIKRQGQRLRQYYCSSGPGSFEPGELMFELAWEEK